MNTISAASGEEDFTDPYFRRGGSLTLTGRQPGGLSVGVRWEEHVGAQDVVSEDPEDTGFRPVRSIDEGRLGALTVQLPVSLPWEGQLQASGELGRMGDRVYGALQGDARWTVRDLERRWHAELSLGGGALTQEAPVQALYLLGGRWTLPGHDYRAFVGDRYWLLRGELTVPVVAPYVGVRLIGGLGAS